MEIWFHPAGELSKIVAEAAKKAGLEESFDPQIRNADPRFGDFQANGILPAAKAAKTNPRALAQKVAEEMENGGGLDKSLVDVSIAGAGFINFRLTPKFLNAWLAKYKGEGELAEAARKFYDGKKMIIDYPSPNTAKQMHVGHLRPMVIGEAVKRLLKFCGADIKTDNHIGDWGTNFGILIYGIKTQNYKLDAANENSLEELEQMYKRGSALAKENPAAADAARAELVKLQNGDPENVALWNEINKVSTAAFERMYKRMGLTIDMTLGESYYRDKVARVYKELTEIGLAEENQGALVVFHKEHERFAKQPFIIRKSDGASNYASTDLATILNRVENLGAEEVVYVTDGRQQDHFQQLFLTVKKWFAAKGYRIPEMRHVWFGTILGEDGKAIKTKSGEPIRLRALLDEAVARARKLVREKNPDIDDAEADKIAETVGVAAVRYSDLVQNRTSDYVFSWDKLLAFDGNTAPYLLYAAARIHSIFRKAGLSPDADFPQAGELETEQEIALAHKLIALPSIFELTLAELRPHFLCAYLYELAGTFSTFYNANKVIVDEEPVRQRRLMLCARTLNVLEAGLRLLGIDPLQKM